MSSAFFCAVKRMTELSRKRKPGGRAGIAPRRHRSPAGALEGRAAPQRTLERIADDVEEIGRAFRIQSAEAQAMQIKFRPFVLRQRRPVVIDLPEQRFARLGAITRLDQQGEPARQIGILQGDARDIAAMQIFDRIHRRRIDPTGSSRHDHDQDGALEGADALELGQCKRGPFLCRFGGVEADIDADRLKRRLTEKRADLFPGRPRGDELAAAKSKIAPRDQRGGAASL